MGRNQVQPGTGGTVRTVFGESADRGDPVRLGGQMGTVDGAVYFASAHAIGVRTPDALYRFMRGFGKPVIAAHHLFAAADRASHPVLPSIRYSRTSISPTVAAMTIFGGRDQLRFRPGRRLRVPGGRPPGRPPACRG
jgi:hypothetical protein